MNTIQKFKHEMFGEIRIITNERGETFFVGKDVAKALGYSNTSKAIQQHVDKEDRSTLPIRESAYETRATIINESGLYALILSSQLPQAKAFKRWVTCEVLPQIWRTGGYIPTRNPRTGEQLTESEIIMAANRIMQRTIEHRNLPTEECLTMKDVAIGVGVEPLDLCRFLVDKGIICWKGGRYHLTPNYDGQGFAESRLFSYFSRKGEAKQKTYLVWTRRGKDFINQLISR